MTERDPELDLLLAAEIEKNLALIEGPSPDPSDARRALHALKGSAGLAGYRELASALTRFERRQREGEAGAMAEAAVLLRRVAAKLRAGEPLVFSVWPEPPEDLVPVPLDPEVRSSYLIEVADRLARIDAALATHDDPLEVLLTIYRHVHTIKGAASAAGDEPMTWFCHGLEGMLGPARANSEAAVLALSQVSGWRAVLGALLEDPSGALSTLRARISGRPQSTAPSLRPLRTEDDAWAAEDATIRVSTQSVDRLLDWVGSVGLARERLTGRGKQAADAARRARAARTDLAEALRLIGPPRPWGAPAAALARIEVAMGRVAEVETELDRISSDVHLGQLALREASAGAKRQLQAMRQTPLRGIFARVAAAVDAEARRENKLVVVRTQGADETIDRHLAEELLDPVLTLARNTVAHGIESVSTREAAGKPAAGNVTLSARKTHNRLVITFSDDGPGVDVAAVRKRAVESGAVTHALAEAADDDTLLALLFLPGFTTREGSDLLAGRGIGLDLASASVQRLGGTMRLASRRGEGFEARIEVPMETGVGTVLWVVAGGLEHAFLASQTRRVLRMDEALAERVPHLAACLEPRASDRAPLALELDVDESEALRVGVDDVGRTEEVLLRPLGSTLGAVGPYAGAVVRGDGSLRLAVDAFALAPRVRALGRVWDGRSSDPSSLR